MGLTTQSAPRLCVVDPVLLGLVGTAIGLTRSAVGNGRRLVGEILSHPSPSIDNAGSAREDGIVSTLLGN